MEVLTEGNIMGDIISNVFSSNVSEALGIIDKDHEIMPMIRPESQENATKLIDQGEFMLERDESIYPSFSPHLSKEKHVRDAKIFWHHNALDAPKFDEIVIAKLDWS